MLWGINIGNLSELLMVLLTCLATGANILLWFTTRTTVRVLIQQVNHQIASDYSSAQHNVVDAHRQIFFGILNNPSLLDGFTQANDLNPRTWELEKIAEFLINQVLICYLNFATEIINPVHFEGFKRDAQDVFAYPSVRNHWEHVRMMHSEDFRTFVETELLWKEIPTI